MGPCQLIFQLQVPAIELLNQIRKLAQEHDGQLNGDEKSGNFSLQIFGSIEGNYSIEDNKLHLDITKKPMLIGCEMISSMIKQYLDGLA